jgi:hypothetical protein
MASDDREFKAHTSLQDPTIVYPSPDIRGSRPYGIRRESCSGTCPVSRANQQSKAQRLLIYFQK